MSENLRISFAAGRARGRQVREAQQQQHTNPFAGMTVVGGNVEAARLTAVPTSTPTEPPAGSTGVERGRTRARAQRAAQRPPFSGFGVGGDAA